LHELYPSKAVPDEAIASGSASGSPADHYRELNKEWRFFETSGLKQHRDRVTQFVQPPRASKRATGKKLGRNDPCPCGSGKKYKKCHG